MGFWNKFGKIALQAAPYVAAPFTGGASLLATGMTQKLGQDWAAHDAQNAINKGIAPSKFDKYLGLASGVAGMASGTGLLGKGMTPPNNVSPNTAKLLNFGNQTIDMLHQPYGQPQYSNSQPIGIGPSNQGQPQGKQQYGQMPSGGDMRDPAHGMFGRNFGIDQNNPNLAPSIAQGRVKGLRDTGQLPPSRFQRRLA